MTGKKRILWIDRDHPKGLPSEKKQFEIATALQKRYDIDRLFDLDYWVVNVVDKSFQEGRPYQSMISHVPYDAMFLRNSNLDTIIPKYEFYKKTYERSLGILKRIKEIHPSLPLIAYTGADYGEPVETIFKQLGRIDTIVRKTGEWYADFNLIQQHLNELLGDKFPLGIEEK